MSRLGRGQQLRERLLQMKEQKKEEEKEEKQKQQQQQIGSSDQHNENNEKDSSSGSGSLPKDDIALLLQSGPDEAHLSGKEKRMILLEKIKARRKKVNEIVESKSHNDNTSSSGGENGSSTNEEDFEKHRIANDMLDSAIRNDIMHPVAAFRDTSSSSTSESDKDKSLRQDSSSGYKTNSSSSIQAVQGNLSEMRLNEPNENRGTSGKPIQLESNYVRLKQVKGEYFYEYEVRFEPNLDSRNARFSCFGKASERFGKERTFDGVKLCLPHQLKDKVTKLKSCYLPAFPEVEISVIFKNRRHFSDREAIQLFNLMFAKIMRELKMVQMNRNYYDPVKASTIPHMKLEVWPGYITSVQSKEGGLMLLCEVSNRVLRTDTVYNVMTDINQMKNSRNNEHFDVKKEMKVKLEGEHVLTRYNNKHYRIDEIDFNSNPMMTFLTSKGTEKTYIDYYKEQYNINIKDPKQPMIISRPKKRCQDDPERLICLVPELCYLTGLSTEHREDHRKMKELSKHLQSSPGERSLAVKKFLQSVKDNPNCCELLFNWGLELDEAAITIGGRRLDDIKLVFGNNQTATVNEEFDRILKDAPMFTAVPLRKWLIICDSRKKRAVESFNELFYPISKKLNMMVAAPKEIYLQGDQAARYCQAIESEFRTNPDLQMVFCILNEKRGDKYAAIKKLCYTQLGLPCQVMLAKQTMSVTPKTRTIVARIGMQINAKLGGEIWACKSPYKNAMVVGIDVYHNPDKRSNSWCGLVASLNMHFTRWTSHTVEQTAHMEITSQMTKMFCNALEQYYKFNHELPDKIIIYRDGVGDSRLNFVQDTELTDLKEAFNAFPSYDPQVTMVVVSKRINTRFMFINQEKREYDNPPTGTVVDHTVTSREWFDFFMVSQKVRQGTVSPTHYIVVSDGIGMGPDKIQKLTYRLCFMYYHCSYPVKVPAPCLYAHRLAGQTGEFLKRAPEKMDNNILFYL